ncbi:hypothetical protein K1719_045781 [Acacia pycnantha]|nr:hypothetical protein K1719_045781 [Acacia pycnantha]
MNKCRGFCGKEFNIILERDSPWYCFKPYSSVDMLSPRLTSTLALSPSTSPLSYARQAQLSSPSTSPSRLQPLPLVGDQLTSCFFFSDLEFWTRHSRPLALNLATSPRPLVDRRDLDSPLLSSPPQPRREPRHSHSSVPSYYVQPPETRPGNLIPASGRIVLVIDLGANDPAAVVANIMKASKEFGFFQKLTFF